MNTPVFINGTCFKIDQSQLIQAGGEGLVFQLQQTALKLYHQPNAQHQAKLHALLNSRLYRQLPPAVLAPFALVTDEQQTVIGFQMPLLPAGSQPLKRLSNPIFRQKQGLPATAILSLLQILHDTLTCLHQQAIIAGDLNDTNLFFQAAAAARLQLSWIDVDSFQFSHFPCPVAMVPFLDPTLYGVSDFSTRPYFTEKTDWYAFSVLLVKCLLGVHPYGGTHPQLKTLQTRAQAHLPVWHRTVTYPQNAFPLDTLSDDLLHHLDNTFDKGDRSPFPPALLENGLRWAGNSLPKKAAVSPQQPATSKLLLAVAGIIEQVTLTANGRILAITSAQNSYQLHQLGIGGQLKETPLFTGGPGYRFALFDQYLVVNPPGGKQLLILDIQPSTPQTVAMLETDTFQETAVFAATPTHLYRLAGNWIMQGSVQGGHFVEEMVAPAHRQQTQFFASPYTDMIAGYHRIFAEYRFFLNGPQGSFELSLPSLAAAEHIAQIGIAFGRDTTAVILVVRAGGTLKTTTAVFSTSGQLIDHWQQPDDQWETVVRRYPLTQQLPDVSDLAICRQMRKGLLVQEINQLLYCT